MSFSVSVSATSTSGARAQLSQTLDQVVSQQPIHDKDRATAEASANAVIDLMGEPAEGQVIAGSVSGSIMVDGDAVRSISLSMNFGFRAAD